MSDKAQRVSIIADIYRRYYRPLLVYAFELCENKDDAEDLVADTFLKFVNYYGDKLDQVEHRKTYNLLTRIAKNKYIDDYRKTKHKPNEISLESFIDVSSKESFVDPNSRAKLYSLYLADCVSDEFNRLCAWLVRIQGKTRVEALAVIHDKHDYLLKAYSPERKAQLRRVERAVKNTDNGFVQWLNQNVGSEV